MHSPLAYRTVWEQKPVLRVVYGDIYRRIIDALVPGPTLEVGGGSGNLKAVAPELISSDILFAPWLNLVCDAQRLPFAENRFAGLVMFDVLHHVENPLVALREARRVLRPGGRLILCEPAITPFSGLFYRMFHEEPVDMSADPMAVGPISTHRNPYASNQAIPTLLVGQDRERLAHDLPDFPLESIDWFSFLAYPLSGGFRRWSALPLAAAAPLLRIEWRLRRIFGRLAAFRLLAVYRKQA